MGKMRTRIGVILLVCMMLLCVLPVTALAGDEPTTIYVNATYDDSTTPSDGTETAPYTKLIDAVGAAKDGDTVKLLSDATGCGIVIDSSKYATKGLTIDFGGNTYTVDEAPLAGSSGTESQCFQLLTGGSVTMKNGTVKTTYTGVAMIIQNYCNLTLDSMNVDGSGMTRTGTYTMSNNCGNVVIQDSTITAKTGDVAFDVYGGFQSYGDVTVTVVGNSEINGTVEVDRGNQSANTNKLIIEGGTFNGDIEVKTFGDEKTEIDISGGTFSTDISKYLDDDSVCIGSDGSFTVSDLTTENAVAVIVDTPYKTLEAAIDAAVDGDVVVLKEDIEVDVSDVQEKGGAITIDKKITLDGNDNTIKAVWEDKGDEKAKNATLLLLLESVEVKNLTVDGNKVIRHGVQAYGENADVTLNTVAIQNNDWYGLLVNNGASVTAEELNTTGNAWGVNVDAQTTTASFEMSSGTIAEEASIVIESEGTGKTETTITGGEFQNVGVKPVEIEEPEKEDGVATITISDGTFTSVQALEGDVVQISGGTYSTEIPEEYCADGFVLVENADGTFGVEPEAVATKITLDKTSLTLVKGDTATLTATVEPAEATNKDEIVWTTSNSDIATVEAGKITAVGYGTATITAKIGDVFATCAVSVICDDENCAYYDDVNEDAWYHPAVDFVTEQGIMQGIAEKTFAPEMELTRAQFAQILYNMEGKPEYETDKTFDDVQEKEDGEDVWYYDAVMWAASAGVVKGYNDNSFKPDTSITRQEMVTMLHRYAEYKNALSGDLSEDLDAFPDSESPSVWDKEAFAWAVQYGIVNGKDGELAAGDTARRCEIAKIIMAYNSAISE